MKCVGVYKELYHQEPFDVAFCPYRISPLGAHIDHQYGKINGLAIDREFTWHTTRSRMVLGIAVAELPEARPVLCKCSAGRKAGRLGRSSAWRSEDAGREAPFESRSIRHYRRKSADWWFVLVSFGHYLLLIGAVQAWYPPRTDGNDPPSKGSGKISMLAFLAANSTRAVRFFPRRITCCISTRKMTAMS